jgi:hypothetical protein
MKTKNAQPPSMPRTSALALLATLGAVALAAVSTTAHADGTAAATADIRYSIDSAVLDGAAGGNTFVANTGSQSTGHATLSRSSGQLTFGLNTGSGATSDYGLLAGYFNTVSLETTGASITLEYAVTVSTTEPDGLFSRSQQTPFRLGFFDSSAGQKLEGNYQWRSSGRFANYTGYTTSLGSSGGYGALSQRLPDSKSQELVVGLSKLGDTGQRIGSVTNGLPANFTGTFKIERISGTGIRITSTLNGETPSTKEIVTSSSLVGKFDTFVIAGFAGTSPTAALTFTRLTVTAVTPHTP